MASMPDSVVRQADGRIGLRMVERERAIVRALLDDLRAILAEVPPPPGVSDADGDDDDPVAADAGHSAGPDDGAAAADDAAHPLGAPPFDDPVLARLYPDARPDDPAWSGRFRDMIRGDLDEGRRERLAVVAATLDERSIDDVQAEAWLHVLNDLRLVMGTRLGVTDATEREAFDPEDPDATAKIVFAYAGWLEGQFIDVLAAALPDVSDEEAPDGTAAEDDTSDEGVAEDDS